MSQYISRQHESELIGLIYDAALKPEHWRQVLTLIKETMDVNDCSILFYDAQCRSRNYADSSTTNEAVIEQYLRDYIDTEVAVLNENLKHVPAGLAVRNNQLRVSNDSYEQLFAEGYSTLMNKLELRAGIIFIKGKIISSALGIRSYNNKLPTDQGMAFLQRLSPHIQQSMEIYNQATSLQTAYASIKSALEATKTGVFLISDSQQVMFANTEAIRILEADSGLNIGKGGRLQHNNLQEHIKLQQAIDLQLSQENRANALNRTLAIAHQNTLIPMKLNLLSIHHNHAQKFSEAGASLAIFVKDPNRPLEIPAQYLRQAYSFTDAEIDIAQELLSEIHLKDISKKRNISSETTRWHIKKITQKTNTHSQVELMKLLTCLSSELA